MTPYPKYKSTRIDWLPLVPEHWEMSKAKYYFKYTTGFTPPSGQGDFYNEGITWITIADMDRKIVEESANTLSQLAIDRYNPDLTKKGSLLFSFKLSVGKVAFAGTDLYTNEAIISILPDKNYDVRYYYYTLPEQLLQNANENIYGAKMLNQELIRNASICFPPLKEQTVIANYLDEKTKQIDELITNKQKLIELLKEERIAMINEAVSGEGKNWERKKLKYVAKINPSKPSKDFPKASEEEVIFLPMEKVSEDGEINQDLKKKISDVSSGFTYFEKNDVIVAKITPCFENGKGALLTDLETDFGYGSTEFHTLRAGERILPEFLFAITKSERFMKIGEAFMTGSAGQKRVPTSFVENFIIGVPSLKEQYVIVEHIQTENNRINDTISKIEKEIELMQEYRTALISEVVTGKVKVT